MSYTVENILSDRQVSDLINLFLSMPSNPAHQDYNLFDVDKRHPTGEQREGIDAFGALEKFAERELYSHYFLEYGPEAFTRMHTDNVDDVGLTMVTVLKSDCIGGDTLVHLPYEKRQRPSNKYAKREKGQEAPIDQKIIPKVVQVKDGQTMIYKRDLLHGVGQVEKGTRLVLVSWYKTNETD